MTMNAVHSSLFGRDQKSMTTFDKREEAFEKKFALDEQQKFRVDVRRNRLLGLWAAERLGMAGDAAAAYAKDVVAADLEEAGDGDLVRKLLGDLSSKGVPVTEELIRAKINEFAARAAAEVKAGI
jgi:hypothetical protein